MMFGVVPRGFTRLDAALYAGLTRHLRTQVNVENLFDRRHFATSHGDDNVMPGASRTTRLALVTTF